MNDTKIVDELIKAYGMEMETYLNYQAVAFNLDGLRASIVKEALSDDLETERGHQATLAGRIHALNGIVPVASQVKIGVSMFSSLTQTDVKRAISAVILAEQAAISQYEKIVAMCKEDLVTQNIVLGILEDEQGHRREFAGYLKEYEKTV